MSVFDHLRKEAKRQKEEEMEFERFESLIRGEDVENQ